MIRNFCRFPAYQWKYAVRPQFFVFDNYFRIEMMIRDGLSAWWCLPAGALVVQRAVLVVAVSSCLLYRECFFLYLLLYDALLLY